MDRKRTFLSHISLFPAVCTVLLFAGCVTVGPDYIRPEMSMPDRWNAKTGPSLTDSGRDARMLAEWWSTLNDPELTSLLDRAATGNLNLKNARARVREARARRGIAKAGLFPTLDAAGSAAWSHSSGDGQSGGTSELYSASFDASWELDVFGGVRRAVEASQADLEASQEDLRDVLVSLLAEVALNYVEVRTFQERIAVAEGNLTVQDETYRLAVWQYQAGLGDELAVQEARYNLESTRSQIPALRTGLDEAMNRIAVLLGGQPGAVHRELKKSAGIPVALPTVAIGVPADVLRRRPDIRQAERELAAQTARIGVATADLYPRFALSGSIGLEALSLHSLVSSAITSVGGGSLITWPIFRGGAIRQNIEMQSALQEQALIQYETSVLNAMEEVENLLMAYAEEQTRRDVLRDGEEAARKAVELAQLTYEAGLTNFINVLVAQRSLLSFQDQLAQSSGTVTSDLVRLYKALGGGWESLLPVEKD